LKKIEVQEKRTKKAIEEISKIKETLKSVFQKVAVLRFNPFKGMGSDQSFSIALLDGEDNGFVVSSLYGRDGNRIYAKSVEKGRSKYILSEEEKRAIKQAGGSIKQE